MKLSNAKIVAKKMAWNSAYIAPRYWYTRTRISEPTPWDVSILLIISRAKSTSFWNEILSECFKYFYMKNRKIIYLNAQSKYYLIIISIINKYNKK